MHDWEANVHVDGELVRALLTEQFPQLDAESARPLDEGWDNAVWVVEERWAFRFPRRVVGVPLLERELAVLPYLAPLLPVAVPVPVHLGRPSERYPWPFAGSALLPGREPTAAVTEEMRAPLGAALGSFLRTLHAEPTKAHVEAELALPVDPNRRADMSFRVPMARERIAELERLGLWRSTETAGPILAEAAGLPAANGTLVIAHGDLHFRHLLLENGALSGVIDWGDVCLADPAIDLLSVWSLLPPAGRRCFSEEYGAVGEEQLLRARVLALFLCAVLALYGHHEGLESVEREALAGLERALVDDWY